MVTHSNQATSNVAVEHTHENTNDINAVFSHSVFVICNNKYGGSKFPEFCVVLFLSFSAQCCTMET
jgi:hypothetical protein